MGFEKRIEICIEELSKRDFPGYAIGGLAIGESKDHFWKMVNLCTDHLPQNKPSYPFSLSPHSNILFWSLITWRYLMGVGYSIDLVICSALGVGIFHLMIVTLVLFIYFYFFLKTCLIVCFQQEQRGLDMHWWMQDHLI